MLGLRGVVYGIGVMACAGPVVYDAWCVSCKGEGDGICRYCGVSVGWVFGGCWVSGAVGVGARIGLGGEIQGMAWGDVSACRMRSVV